MLEIFINDSRIDIDDNETIVQSFAANKISDIASRNSSYSNTFKVPRTANNRAIFESPEVLLNDSRIPYTKLPCKVYVDGLIVVNGSAQLTKTGGFYDVKIFGTNFDFFSVIKAKLLSELDLSDYNHTWDLATIVASRLNDEGYIYGLIDYQVIPDNAYFSTSSTGRDIDVRTLYPGMFLHTLIDRIISEAGFTKSDDAIWTNENYLKVIIPFSADSFNRIYNQEEDFKAIKTSNQGITGIDQLVTFTNDSTDGGFDNGGNYDGVSKYVVPFNMKCAFTAVITIATQTGSSADLAILASVNATDNIGIIVETQPANTTVTYTLNIPATSLLAGDEVEIYVSENSGLVTIYAGAYFESHVQPNIQWETEVQMSSTLPKLKQGDFFKWFLQMFQAVVQVKNGVVAVRTFTEIKNNVVNALDWSEKVDETETDEVTFNMDKYAQLNRMTYKEDSTVTKPIGTDYDLLIDNENLEAETDLIESPFAATEMVLRLIYENIPNIKKLTALEITTKCEPRILILGRRDVETAIDYIDPTSSTTSVTTDLPFMWFIIPGADFNLGFEDNLIPLYGTDVVDLLQEQKVLNKLMRINAADINMLDFFTPIWLRQYNCYFFLSSIDQYKMNAFDSTNVELVKLPS